MTIAFMWAEAKDHVIGAAGQLPWHLPADMQHFKTVTQQQIVVMGRRTYASIGKALPNRTNIVLSHQAKPTVAPSVLVMHQRQEVLTYAHAHPQQETIVIGGAQIFSLFKTDVTKLYVTRIHAKFSGDTYMPALDWATFTRQWQQVGQVDEKNHYPYVFECYQRKSI